MGTMYKYVVLFLVLTFTACSKNVDTQAELQQEQAIPVEFAFALQQQVRSKANTALLPELNNTESFRGMEDIRVVPFGNTDGVGMDDLAVGAWRRMPSITSDWDHSAQPAASAFHSGLIYNNQAHFYPSDYASMPVGTAAALVYGKGYGSTLVATPAGKHNYGSIIESGWETQSITVNTADIRFSPEPIYSGAIPAAATELADLMNDIAEAATFTKTFYYKRNDEWCQGAVSVTWNEELTETVLRDYFEWFTNGGDLMPGSGRSVESMMSGLFYRLSLYYSVDDRPYKQLAGGREYATYMERNESQPLTWQILYNGLRDAILDRFHNMNTVVIDTQHYTVSLRNAETLLEYPSNLGLPSGAAVLQWNGLRFIVASEGLDKVAPMDRFCYMPPLLYFVNTTISTSADSDIYKKYTEDALTWNAILSNYRQGKVVKRSTSAVALDSPLQYATGMLSATVQSSASSIPDKKGKMISVSGINFPVTGIILGGQHTQKFNFMPVASSREYYLYDNQVSGIYLTQNKSASFRTLSLQTIDAQDIYFCLELRNNSGSAFTGADGVIYPGSNFYLAGKLVFQEGTDLSGQHVAFPAVFMQDHVTKVDCIIPSLANALVAIPELDNPQLLIGVQTEMNWIMSTGSYVVLN